MLDALYLDIETIPAQRPDVLAAITEECQMEMLAALEDINPPANYKDPAKIAEWNATVRLEKVEAIRVASLAKVDECYRKTGLDGAFGQVCAIGYAFNDEAPAVLANMNERTLLSDFSAALKRQSVKVFDCTVIGHNVSGFDLRFLTQRHIVAGVRPHPIIGRAASAKPWEAEKVFDTMVQWCGVKGSVSLDKLCRALGIQSPKGDLDGSKVWDYVKAGRLQEVAAYCAGDVLAVRLVHRRMTFAVQPVEQFDDVPA